jgi:hypothetical protein
MGGGKNFPFVQFGVKMFLSDSVYSALGKN